MYIIVHCVQNLDCGVTSTRFCVQRFSLLCEKPVSSKEMEYGLMRIQLSMCDIIGKLSHTWRIICIATRALNCSDYLVLG